jgi:hypothetical protein
MASVVGWFLLGIVDSLTAQWTRRKALGAAFFLTVGLVVAGLGGIDSIGWWAASGLLTGLFGLAAYAIFFRAAPEALAVAVAATYTLSAIKAGWSAAYPGVVVSSGLRVAALFATAWLLLFLWKKREARGRSETA